MAIIAGAFQHTTWYTWDLVLKINAYGSAFVFGVFVLADYMGYSACATAVKAANRLGRKPSESVVKHRREIKLMIFAVDLPGLLGILSIDVLSHLLYPSCIQYYYWHGFVAGAIALHIAFSQTALALIAARGEDE